MDAIVVIPARFGSTRLPGKPILQEAKEITGRYIIEHVYYGASKARLIKKVIVATDDKRIYSIVKQFGGDVEMTPANLSSGTDRIAWVVKNIDAVKDLNPSIVVNVQGDEPDICGDMIDEAISILRGDSTAVMSTLANKIEDAQEIIDPHVVKVVLDNNGDALYFSRSPIPYVKDIENYVKEVDKCQFLRHIGLYVYRKDFLLDFPTLPVSRLEEIEGLEQLRVLSNGYKIKVAVIPYNPAGIDTREDFERFLERYRSKND